jgi:hypothetical protein
MISDTKRKKTECRDGIAMQKEWRKQCYQNVYWSDHCEEGNEGGRYVCTEEDDDLRNRLLSELNRDTWRQSHIAKLAKNVPVFYGNRSSLAFSQQQAIGQHPQPDQSSAQPQKLIILT